MTWDGLTQSRFHKIQPGHPIDTFSVLLNPEFLLRRALEPLRIWLNEFLYSLFLCDILVDVFVASTCGIQLDLNFPGIVPCYNIYKTYLGGGIHSLAITHWLMVVQYYLIMYYIVLSFIVLCYINIKFISGQRWCGSVFLSLGCTLQVHCFVRLKYSIACF